MQLYSGKQAGRQTKIRDPEMVFILKGDLLVYELWNGDLLIDTRKQENWWSFKKRDGLFNENNRKMGYPSLKFVFSGPLNSLGYKSISTCILQWKREDIYNDN